MASAATASLRNSDLRSNEHAVTEDEAGPKDLGQQEMAEESIAVKRTAGIGARGRGGVKDNKLKKDRSSVSTALSFGDDGEEPAFQLKRSALAQMSRIPIPEAPSERLPETLEQASIAETSNRYNASALAALKASTPARRQAVEEDGDLDLAHREMIDPTTQIDGDGNNLTRLKFGADFTHDGIPNEALVTAAKERRRRAAEEHRDVNRSDDFISLRDTRKDHSPHPESRLQREEDDLGSGEEEFAEFTGATERVALGKKAINEAKRREREEMKEAMDLDNDSDDSGKEWERAQMGRMEGMGSRKQIEKREKSPFRPALIPMTAPLPTLTSTSARLIPRIAALESSIKSHGQVIDDAGRQLAQLENDEKRSKAELVLAGEKEAWFRELEEFISSLSTFLEVKVPQLEKIENDWRRLLAKRAMLTGAARAHSMTDEACLFHGVPASSLVPSSNTKPDDIDYEGEDIIPPNDEGGPLSVVRETRRLAAGRDVDSLTPADESALEVAQKEILRRLGQMFDDVKAPEFFDPAARVDAKLHPSSLLARFHQWRTLYPSEYANAWGGLTLADIWDFWVRKELCCWDLPKAGHQALDSFKWYKNLTHYSAVGSSKPKGEGGSGTTAIESIGGDDEAISHVVCNTLITQIIVLCEQRVFDPWNAVDAKSMSEILEQIGYILERDHLRYRSLVSSFLNIFGSHITPLVDSMTSPPVVAPPPFDPRSPIALLSYLDRVKTLFFNMLLLNRFVPPSEKPFYLDMIDRLVGTLIWNLLSKAKDTGGKEIARSILTRCARTNVLQEDVRARLAAMSQ
ncbi:hypothetical protein CBS101457_000605 [Exobasidium rhododendri]|nr:hypothetical protein CBS101457_000605 [Exobasidium rhododendri]